MYCNQTLAPMEPDEISPLDFGMDIQIKIVECESPVSPLSSTSTPGTSPSSIDAPVILVEDADSKGTSVDPPDVDWINILNLAGLEHPSSPPAPKRYYDLLLEQTVSYWSLGNIAGLHRNCQFALAHGHEMSLFHLFCFTTIDLVVYQNNVRLAKEMLDMYVKVDRRRPKVLASNDWDALVWLRQIVGRRDMAEELRACLGMRSLNLSVPMSRDDMRHELDSARRNLKERSRMTDRVHRGRPRSVAL